MQMRCLLTASSLDQSHLHSRKGPLQNADKQALVSSTSLNQRCHPWSCNDQVCCGTRTCLSYCCAFSKAALPICVLRSNKDNISPAQARPEPCSPHAKLPALGSRRLSSTFAWLCMPLCLGLKLRCNALRAKNTSVSLKALTKQGGQGLTVSAITQKLTSATDSLYLDSEPSRSTCAEGWVHNMRINTLAVHMPAGLACAFAKENTMMLHMAPWICWSRLLA